MVVRPFLPESPVWRDKRAAGTLKRPSFRALFAPELRRTTLVTTLMVRCLTDARSGNTTTSTDRPGVPQVREQTKGVPPAQARQIQQQTAALLTNTQEFGGLLGRFVLAILALCVL
jgi:hypothetical protein